MHYPAGDGIIEERIKGGWTKSLSLKKDRYRVLPMKSWLKPTLPVTLEILLVSLLGACAPSTPAKAMTPQGQSNDSKGNYNRQAQAPQQSSGGQTG